MTFPLVCPTELTIKPGSHPTKKYRSINGATRTRLFGSAPVDATVSARFSCSTKEAAEVMHDYHATYSGSKPVVLPIALFKGHLELYDALPRFLQWFYSGEPEASPVFMDRVTLSVDFEGRLEV